MGNAISAAAALCAAISAVDLVNFLDARQGRASTRVAAQAPPLHSGIRDLLLLSSAAGFSISVAFIYRHLHRGAAAGTANRRLPEIQSFMLCICAGVLHFFLFVLTPGGADVDHGAQAQELGLAALRVLPAAATATFFLGTMLIVAAHIRAGGEGGGGAVAVAGEEPIQVPLGLRLLSRMALAAAAGLVCLMAIAFYGAY
jgi:hypothetical protein